MDPCCNVLTLTGSTLIKFSADDILKYFSNFLQKTGFDISNDKTCFLGKIRKISICHLLTFLIFSRKQDLTF